MKYNLNIVPGLRSIRVQTSTGDLPSTSWISILSKIKNSHVTKNLISFDSPFGFLGFDLELKRKVS